MLLTSSMSILMSLGKNKSIRALNLSSLMVVPRRDEELARSTALDVTEVKGFHYVWEQRRVCSFVKECCRQGVRGISLVAPHLILVLLNICPACLVHTCF